MAGLAFSNSYTVYTKVPAIRLAARLISLGYPNLRAVFCCNSGSEAVEGAIKVARFYWHLQGKSEKTTIIARREAYHGGTLGATAATGLPAFHKGFWPLADGFARAETCYPYRCGHCLGTDDCDLACAHDIQQVIVNAGP